MDKLIEILESIEPDVDYQKETKLIDNHILNSLAIISLVAEIEEKFDITIPTVEIVPDNFNSAASLMDLINRLQEEE